jgi:hypothetical protein
MLLTCLPYGIVWFYLPLNHVFPGILFNSDDHGVYFAWMRQAQDGQLLFRNLFTTEPQRGVYFHAYFLLLGWLSRLPGLDIPLAYHLGRLVCGTVTLALVYRLGAFFTADVFSRRCIFWVTALSAGLGWLFWLDSARPMAPVDVWQPEAVTFASLYTNGLFAVSLALMLGVVVCLLLAETRGWRWAAGAGLCGLLLGNVHSYDVIHLAVVWAAYLLLRWAVSRRFPARETGFALLAAAVASPSVLYMAWLYLAEPVFRSRADIETISGPIRLYLLGYGLLVPLALWGAALLWPSERRRDEENTGTAITITNYDHDYEKGRTETWDRRPETDLRFLLPIAWFLMGLIPAYLPFAFQRKMIMGYHLPVALLAGLALAELARRLAGSVGRPKAASLVAGAVVAVLSVSNVRYMWRDVQVALTEQVTSTGAHPVYWPDSDIRAFEWAGRQPGPGALMALPFNGVLAPAYSGRPVYAGHWGETPRFGLRVRESVAFYRGDWSSEERHRFLTKNAIRWVVLSPLERASVRDVVRPLETEPFLRPVFTEGDTTVFEVSPAPAGG